MTRYVRGDGTGDDLTLDSAFDNAVTAEDIIIDDAFTDTANAVCAVDCQVQTQGEATHSGKWDSGSPGHYVLNVSSGDAIQIIGAYTVTLDGLCVQVTGTAGSEECIEARPGTSDSVTIKNCILRGDASTNQQDGVYGGFNVSIGTINVEQSIMYDFHRGGINIQNSANQNTYSATFNINSCLLWNNGLANVSGNGGGGGIVFIMDGGGTNIDINVHNTISVENDTGTGAQDYYEDTPNTSANWNISYSIDSDGTINSRDSLGSGNQGSIAAHDADQGAGSYVIFQDITNTPYDLRLRDLDNTKNVAQDEHTTATAEGLTIPSTDIVGTSRPQNTNYDVGPFEVTSVVSYTATASLTIGGATTNASATFSPGTKTASASLDTGAATASANATFTAPVYTADAALASAGASASASATFTAPVYSADAAIAAAGATFAATATYDAGTFTATMAATAGTVALASTATFTAPVYSADAALDVGGATAAATATFAVDTFTATADVTAGPAVAAGTATFTAPTYDATADLNAAGATCAATALFAAEVYSGTAALSASGVTFSGSATYDAGTFTATASLTAGAATASGSATFAAPTYSADLAATSGTVQISATAAFDLSLVTATASLTSGGVVVGMTATFTAAAQIVHYHVLEGPSKQLHALEGPSNRLRMLEGPSKQLHHLIGD